jgi:DNA-binding IclR family transcriptional regulator
MVKRDKANYMIQSVSHALDVVEEISNSSGEIGVTELSKRLKLHKNNVFRLLATLELRGYVDQNTRTENYRLGVKTLQLGQAYLRHSTLVAKAKSVLEELAEETGETVSLAVLQGAQVQFPLSIESKRPVKVAARVAVSFNAKQSAVGRLLTAQLPDATLAEMLAGNSPQDAAIKSQLNELRIGGVTIDRGAVEPDVVAIGKIIRGDNDQVLGAIELLAPQYRAKTDALLPALEEAAKNLSLALGASEAGISAAIEKEVGPGAKAAHNA